MIRNVVSVYLSTTNNGADPAEPKFDRPILSIASNKNPTERRARNLRLWLRTEIRLEQEGPVTFTVLVLLFYTSALEDKGHWVEEPHYAFEWLTESTCRKETDKLTLVFSKDAAKWTPHKLLQRRRSSKDPTIEAPPKSASLFSGKRNDSIEIPVFTSIGTVLLCPHPLCQLSRRRASTDEEAWHPNPVT
jgi:hypothetical protein